MQIQRTSNDLVLQADRFPGDVILWLLNHFEGYIEVYVKSAKVYEIKLGVHTRKITAIVKDTCTNDDRNCNNLAWPVVLAEIIDGEPRRLVGGSSSENLKQCSYQRQKLYKTESLMNTTYTSYKVHIGRKERYEIKHVARRITKWLMDVPTNLRNWPLPGSASNLKLDRMKIEIAPEISKLHSFSFGHLISYNERRGNQRIRLRDSEDANGKGRR